MLKVPGGICPAVSETSEAPGPADTVEDTPVTPEAPRFVPVMVMLNACPIDASGGTASQTASTPGAPMLVTGEMIGPKTSPEAESVTPVVKVTVPGPVAL
jgi:hypothetical protein